MKRIIIFIVIVLLININYLKINGFSKPYVSEGSSSDSLHSKQIIYFNLGDIKIESHMYFEMALTFINQLPENSQKVELTIQTFIKHLSSSSLSKLTLYLNQLENTVPTVFRQLFVHMVLEMEKQQFNHQNILEFIQTNGSLSSQHYVLEEWIMYLINSDQIETAEMQIETIDSQLIKGRLYEFLLIYHLKLNNISYVEKLFKKIQSKVNKDQLYSEFALIYAQKNQYANAVKYINKIKKPSFQEEVKKDVCIEFANNKFFDEALKILSLIKDSLLYTEALTQLSITYALDNKYQSSYQLMSSINNQYYKSKAMAYLGKSLLLTNDIKQANQLLDLIQEEQFRNNLIEDIILYLAKNQQNEAAIQRVNLIKNTNLRYELLLRLAVEFGKQKDYHYQLLLIEKFEPKSIKKKAKKRFYQTYILNQSLSKSLSLIQGLSEKKQINLLLDLGNHLIKENQISLFIQLINSLNTEKLKIQIFTRCILTMSLLSLETQHEVALMAVLNQFDRKDITVNENIMIEVTLLKLYSQTNNADYITSKLKSTFKKIDMIQQEEIKNMAFKEVAKIALKWNFFDIAYDSISKLNYMVDKIILLNDASNLQKKGKNS